MKQKFTTYILLAAVVVIWGIIGYRFLAAKEEPSPTASSALLHGSNTPENVYPLKLNYRDPFFKEVLPKPDSLPPPVKLPSPKKIEIKEPVPMECLGMIHKGGEIFYLIYLLAEHYSVRQGDSIGEFKVKRVDEDSIYLVKGKWTYSAAIPKK